MSQTIEHRFCTVVSLDYIHYNPVKHGWTKRPEDWPDSSFAHWKLRGVYEDRWGWDEPEALGDASWEGME